MRYLEPFSFFNLFVLFESRLYCKCVVDFVWCIKTSLGRVSVVTSSFVRRQQTQHPKWKSRQSIDYRKERNNVK